MDVREMFYEAIQNAIGPTKICNFGHGTGSTTGVQHEGNRVVPIRNFPQKGCSVDEHGTLVITGSGLQGFCRDCDNRRRRVRLDTSPQNNAGGYDTYENNP